MGKLIMIGTYHDDYDKGEIRTYKILKHFSPHLIFHESNESVIMHLNELKRLNLLYYKRKTWNISPEKSLKIEKYLNCFYNPEYQGIVRYRNESDCRYIPIDIQNAPFPIKPIEQDVINIVERFKTNEVNEMASIAYHLARRIMDKSFPGRKEMMEKHERSNVKRENFNGRDAFMSSKIIKETKKIYNETFVCFIGSDHLQEFKTVKTLYSMLKTNFCFRHTIQRILLDDADSF